MRWRAVSTARLLIASCLLLATLSSWSSDSVVIHPTLTNVENVPVADLEFVLREVNNRKPSDVDEAAAIVRYAFQERGYFKVLVADPVITVEKKEGERDVIDVSLAVTSGEKYRLKEIGFTPTTVFSPAELRSAFPISDGETFDREKIAIGLESLRQLYGRKGYVNFSAVPQTTVDEEAHVVGILIDLDEGAVFNLGKLTVLGEESEPGAREKLLKTWESYEGRVYDFTLLYRFLADIHARPGVTPDQIFKLSEDPQARLMNVSITLVKPPVF